jgi:hypothetical protein
MDVRRPFLESILNLVHGFEELARYRVVGNTAMVATLTVNAIDPDKHKTLPLEAIQRLRSVTAPEFQAFKTLYEETSIVLAYSWLDSFVAQVEEALYLHDPSNLGESIQIKLGKVLNAPSLDELIHDLIRRRIRERSQWGLANRIADLRHQPGFTIHVDPRDIEWAAEIRNNIIHSRQHGSFRVSRKKLTYQALRRKP